MYTVAHPYMHLEAADAVVAQAGIDYLTGVTPGLGIQFLMISMFATLRGTGIVKPTMIIQFITVVLNILFAAVLTIGWLTGKPYGAFGAGLATTLATIVRRDHERLLLSQAREVRVVPPRADQAQRGGIEAPDLHRPAHRPRVLLHVARHGASCTG